jgi:hypothetical protein
MYFKITAMTDKGKFVLEKAKIEMPLMVKEINSDPLQIELTILKLKTISYNIIKNNPKLIIKFHDLVKKYFCEKNGITFEDISFEVV